MQARTDQDRRNEDDEEWIEHVMGSMPLNLRDSPE